jgi:hypothetical protein
MKFENIRQKYMKILRYSSFSRFYPGKHIKKTVAQLKPRWRELAARAILIVRHGLQARASGIDWVHGTRYTTTNTIIYSSFSSSANLENRKI